ncbi:MAG: hypothetical protein P1U38_07595 [Aeromicrobium sp.]|uniref:hypothetical protein n=1 Tax=Aeromicrobium sp. TaxID=1871063 RepID=UPI002623378A|nr:hypothetical protein [Aeromicrobium sp.]MDF1704622.1 hypothetical protein [Aeromicrobium sp.]
MPRVEEFDAFYASTSENVLRVAYAVTGDRAVARDATIDAYRHAWRDWDKIRDQEPHRYVRVEAWKAQAVTRGTHPLRRRHEEDSDTELLDALAELSPDDRRLLVLLTIGATDLEAAAREIGVGDEEAIELVTTAITALEQSTGQSIDQLERRLTGLGEITSQLPMPEAAELRDRATRGHRFNTIAVVAASILAIVLGGAVLTEGDALSQLPAQSYRQQLGAERPDLVLDAQRLSTDNLLTTAQVSDLTGDASTWTIDETDQDADAAEPLTICAEERFATQDPLKVFVRTFDAAPAPSATPADQPADQPAAPATTERVAQSIEVARDPAAAAAAYQRATAWFAQCEVPRLQLTGTYRATGSLGDVLLMRLVEHGQTDRTLTVGLGSSGTVTSTVVHETDAAEPPTIDDFAAMVSASFQQICSDSGGECDDDLTVTPADPPPLAEDPGFLGVIDLPAITGISSVWGRAEAEDTATNPAATACDLADFGAAGGTASTRIFLLPEAQGLAKTFGLVETVGTFETAEAATAFVDQVQASVNSCPQNNLAASVVEASTFGEVSDFRGATWTLTLQVESGDPVTVRSAIVQRGASVAQVLFTPSGATDMPAETFAAVAQRATERLAYAVPAG